MRFQTALSPADTAWLLALVADWQMIADLAFSDLVLWVEDVEARGTWAAAQIRPTTGPTTLLEDVVGSFVPTGRHPAVESALAGRAPVGGVPDALGRAVHAVPVRRAGRIIAVVERRREDPGTRSAGALESAYLEVADELFEMIRRGEFPGDTHRSELADSLRVGDGFVRTDPAGVVRFASPNALSAYRRLGLVGDLVGARLPDVTAGLLSRRTQAHGSPGLLAGGEGTEGELENATATLRIRVIAVRIRGESHGSLILLRDVTELRSRERELLSKDATIREIHHRVKNNLQTVAALLRLQGRRLSNPEARHALDEAVRRVGSIALVHETLSHSAGDAVDFDDIADRLLRTVLDVAGDGTVRAERVGSFGSLPGEVATPLAMVLTELIQNAAEHAFVDGRPGHIGVAANRIRDRVKVRVSDDGVGLPADFSAESSLGLSIVSTLVQTELGGSLAFESRGSGGTTVSIALDVPAARAG
ncbi:ATPase/histidine kinase/DNA gyrase B/HSP90 domain protein [Aeromicrobium marinum DSM 15272]|uniref:histidine kinase n=2 Tax=Aeromicrobium marinum TaxID=219314 RepID=E2SCM1_9ACTN|nr:ATPase/histidine kinase/DNA gyrase B/HSP90 domain protein [Aeromicrobium marinum DSM 15272]